MINKKTRTFVRVSIVFVSNCPYTQGFKIPIVGTHKHLDKKEDIAYPLVDIDSIFQKVFCLPD